MGNNKATNIHRQFERAFPELVAEDRRYDTTLETQGKTAAEAERRNQQSKVTIDQTKQILLGTLYDDLENKKEIFIPAEETKTP